MSNETISILLEWAGAISAVIGSLLLALNNEYSRWGWICYLISNLALISFSMSMGLWGILFMQIVFLVTTVIGIYKWFFSCNLKPVSPFLSTLIGGAQK